MSFQWLSDTNKLMKFAQNLAVLYLLVVIDERALQLIKRMIFCRNGLVRAVELDAVILHILITNQGYKKI